jgi:hypothetical protein
MNFIIVLILIIVSFFLFKSVEGFYYHYPPSNCMETVFGTVLCYPRHYFPYYYL